MKEKIINIAGDFSRFPSGRYKTDGKFSGEHFREDFLLPSLTNYDRVVVEIDDVRGYGSSFLEEAFGGLIRKKYFDENDLKVRLIVVGSEKYETYISEIWDYIKEASDDLVA